MKNDFRPVVGHRFSLEREPAPEVKVVVDCEVVEVEPNRTLSYTWSAFGLESIVTWTLTPSGKGTILRMEQSGFPADQKAALKGATASWPRMIDALEELLKRSE